jgi:hypothetical protein
VIKHVILAGLCLAFPVISSADGVKTCQRGACRATFELVSVSDGQGYGLLLAAPDVGCRQVRYRVEGEGKVLGRTPSLRPGELALVRMSRRFVAGAHLLSIAAEGCSALPVAPRRVRLAKASPDHGWRAAAVESVLLVRLK